jgi:hypothetical protein
LRVISNKKSNQSYLENITHLKRAIKQNLKSLLKNFMPSKRNTFISAKSISSRFTIKFTQLEQRDLLKWSSNFLRPIPHPSSLNIIFSPVVQKMMTILILHSTNCHWNCRCKNFKKTSTKKFITGVKTIFQPSQSLFSKYKIQRACKFQWFNRP